MLGRTKVLTRLLAGFALVLVGTLVLGAVATRAVRRLADATADIFEHPYTVSTAILEIKAEVLADVVGVERLAHISDPAEIEQLVQSFAARAAAVDQRVSLVRDRFLGDPRDVVHVADALRTWREARMATVALVRARRVTEAATKAAGPDRALADAVVTELEDVTLFAAAKAADYRRKAANEGRTAVESIVTAIAGVFLAGLAVALVIATSVTGSLRLALRSVRELAAAGHEKVRVVEAVGAGDLSCELPVTRPFEIDATSLPNDDLGALVQALAGLSGVQSSLDHAFRGMTASLRAARERDQLLDWLKTGVNELGALLRGEQDTVTLAQGALTCVVEYLGASVGAFYLFDEDNAELRRAAGYALPCGRTLGEAIALGEGLVGQAAREGTRLVQCNLPPGYLPIESGLGQAEPCCVAAVPLVHDGRLLGALELATLNSFSETELGFLDQAAEGLAVALHVNLARRQVDELLEQTQAQAEELRVQQEELQQTNEELEERAQMLEQQREQIRSKNSEIEAASTALQQKADALARASGYKSEFLANMSHELRTPLNSLMILSRLLVENKDGNLTPKQVEFAQTIHRAGGDLLHVIDDILDIAKVEAGRLEVHAEEVRVADLCGSLEALFRPVAEQKGLGFAVVCADDVPPVLHTDDQRVRQVLRNLLSNAFKFTPQGEVELRLFVEPLPGSAAPCVAFAVRDTGVGIPPDKHERVFQAFAQADGTTSRKFGGTGLGLSISLELARRLGGGLRLESDEGKGSVFTLWLPVGGEENQGRPPPEHGGWTGGHAEGSVPGAVEDDRAALTAGGKSILLVEDDPGFAELLCDLVRQKGFGCLVAGDGETGLALAARYRPDAVVLDVVLPGIDGWTVLERLKDNPKTRDIPVHFLTGRDERLKALALGAVSLVTKPASPEQLDALLRSVDEAVDTGLRRLLIVEDDEDEARSLANLLATEGVELHRARSGREAIALLAVEPFDCVVLDLGLSDVSGFEVLDAIQQLDDALRMPVIVHSGRELTREEETRLRRHTESIIVKGAKSPERLLEEVSLFLHVVEGSLPPEKRRRELTVHVPDLALNGKKVLVVDDDMRNLFSLSALLAEKGVTVVEAENGLEALARLDEHSDVGAVLMDIMMPEMDGYEAMRRIRAQPRFAALPIVAMTAKAVKGDREESLRAGATDYITKPLDPGKLLSLLRVWLYQRG